MIVSCHCAKNISTKAIGNKAEREVRKTRAWSRWSRGIQSQGPAASAPSLCCLSSSGSHQRMVPPTVGGSSHLSSISTCTAAFSEPSSQVIPDFVKLTTNPNHSSDSISVFDLNRQYRCYPNPTWLLCKSSWQSYSQTNAAAEVSRATNHLRRSRTGGCTPQLQNWLQSFRGHSVHFHDDSVGELRDSGWHWESEDHSPICDQLSSTWHQ